MVPYMDVWKAKRFSALVVVAVLGQFSFSINLQANWGHRAAGGSGGYHKDLPENSLLSLKAALLGRDGKEPIQLHEKFSYLEFDIRETADQVLVVFHDSTLHGKLPEVHNRSAVGQILSDEDVRKRVGKKNPKYRDLKVRHVTLSQLNSLKFSSKYPSETVPTFEEFTHKARQWNLVKPFVPEIKNIWSDESRNQFISMVRSFREEYADHSPIIFTPSYDMSEDGVSIISSPGNFIQSFSKNTRFAKKKWCEKFRENGFLKIYRIQLHFISLCPLEFLKGIVKP
jgi:glycerophosphoryl diester phosphodiesterase